MDKIVVEIHWWMYLKERLEKHIRSSAAIADALLGLVMD